MTTRKKYTALYKTKVVLEALKERKTTAELAQKYGIAVQQINLWKRDFLSKAETVFEKKSKKAKTEAQEKEERLLKTIGELKVENDFLRHVLR